MVLEFTANELAELLNIPVSDLQNNRLQKGRVLQYGMYIFGKASDCGGCKDAFKVLYNKLKNEGMGALEKKINRDFDLKPGYFAQLRFGSDTHVSNVNLNNELALEFLSIHRSRIKVFVRFPEDWEARVDAFLAGNPVQETVSETAEEITESTDDIPADTKEVETVTPVVKNKFKAKSKSKK